MNILFTILNVAIILRALLSFFSLPPGNPVLTILYDITEPILAPLRKVVPPIAMIDFTPLVAIFLLQIVNQVLVSILARAPIL